MAFVWINEIKSGEMIPHEDKVEIKNNIDDLRNRLYYAGPWSWQNHPVNSDTIIANTQPNEFKQALDDSHDKNICVNCVDYGDQVDQGDRVDQGDLGDQGDQVDVGDQVDQGDRIDLGDLLNQGDLADDKDCVNVADRADEGDHINNIDYGNDSRQGIDHTE